MFGITRYYLLKEKLPQMLIQFSREMCLGSEGIPGSEGETQ